MKVTSRRRKLVRKSRKLNQQSNSSIAVRLMSNLKKDEFVGSNYRSAIVPKINKY